MHLSLSLCVSVKEEAATPPLLSFLKKENVIKVQSTNIYIPNSCRLCVSLGEMENQSLDKKPAGNNLNIV
jgi:hypothetical protein